MSYTEMSDQPRLWVALSLSMLLGAAVAWATRQWGAFWQWPAQVWMLVRTIYDLVGIALVGLAPISIWLTRLIVHQAIHRPKNHPIAELDYGYISRNATLLGLLGTIIALAMAGGRLAINVSSGASEAVLGIIPYVGQALFSTIVGIVIACIADTALHLMERQRIKEKE